MTRKEIEQRVDELVKLGYRVSKGKWEVSEETRAKITAIENEILAELKELRSQL